MAEKNIKMSYDDDYGEDREFRINAEGDDFGDLEELGEDKEGMHIVGEEESDDPEDRFS